MGRLHLHRLLFSTRAFFTQHFAVAGLSSEPGSEAWELQEEEKAEEDIAWGKSLPWANSQVGESKAIIASSDGSWQRLSFAQRCQTLLKAQAAGPDQQWQLWIEPGSRDLPEAEQGESAKAALG